MPKEHQRVRSVSYYRPSPVTTPTTAQYSTSPYASISSRPLSASMQNPYYTSQQQQQPTMSQSQYQSQVSSSYSLGGPVQHPLAPLPYTHTPIVSPPPTIRPSSGAWNPTDDQTLMAARAQGMNWAPIQQTYFPSKTPNACRKRHERLMEKRNADDWDGLKLETLAKSYMGMRREIWSGLASATGEKWTVVEQKCMSQGFKNLQTAARSHARRERLLDGSASSLPNANGMSAYEDSGIGIDDIDDFGVENDEADGDEQSERSAEGSIGSQNAAAYGMYQQHQSMQSQHHHQSLQGQHHQGQHHQGHHHQSHYQHGGSRLPSMDMGIDAIINRPAGR